MARSRTVFYHTRLSGSDRRAELSMGRHYLVDLMNKLSRPVAINLARLSLWDRRMGESTVEVRVIHNCKKGRVEVTPLRGWGDGWNSVQFEFKFDMIDRPRRLIISRREQGDKKTGSRLTQGIRGGGGKNNT